MPRSDHFTAPAWDFILNYGSNPSIADLSALTPERGGSILSGHSAPRYEIETVGN
jgi:hypothetical protein